MHSGRLERRDTITASIPASRDLPTDETIGLERLRDVNTGTLIGLHEPLAFTSGPNITFTFIAVFVLELLRIGSR